MCRGRNVWENSQEREHRQRRLVNILHERKDDFMGSSAKAQARISDFSLDWALSVRKARARSRAKASAVGQKKREG